MAKLDVDPQLDQILDSLLDLNSKAASSRAGNHQAPWLRPKTDVEWSGSLETLEDHQALSLVFDVSEAEGMVIDAVSQKNSNANTPNNEDPRDYRRLVVAMATTQIDFTQMAERAFRARYQTFPRAVCHTTGSQKNGSSPNGSLNTIRRYLVNQSESVNE